MADFLISFNWAMQSEDPEFAYKTVPDDPPGAWAISGINSHSFPAQFAAINAIPQEERGPAVQVFYQMTFWNKWYAQLTSDDVAKRVFDEAVNGGAETAVILLQHAINSLSGSSVVVDGGWGPATVKAANACGSDPLVMAFVKFRCAHYKNIAEANPAEAQYLPGWLARAEK